jgi:hypothetical protein
MLGHDLDLTKGEGLWEKYGKKVETLYEISGCRQVRPFRQDELVKHDGTRLNRHFKYSYAIVRARPQTEPEFKPFVPDCPVAPKQTRVSIERVIRNTLSSRSSRGCIAIDASSRTAPITKRHCRSLAVGRILKGTT